MLGMRFILRPRPEEGNPQFSVCSDVIGSLEIAQEHYGLAMHGLANFAQTIRNNFREMLFRPFLCCPINLYCLPDLASACALSVHYACPTFGILSSGQWPSVHLLLAVL